MDTLTKILVAVLVLSLLFVVVINIVTDPVEAVAGGEGSGFIGSLWGSSDASLNATCRQKCSTPAPLPDECEQLSGDICE